MVCDLLAGGDLRYHLQQKVCTIFYRYRSEVCPLSPLHHLTRMKYGEKLTRVCGYHRPYPPFL